MKISQKLLLCACAFTAFSMQAEDITITEFESFGPYPMPKYALFGDSAEIKEKNALDYVFTPEKGKGKFVKLPIKVKSKNNDAIGVLAFDLENREYTSATITVDSLEDVSITLDGAKISSGSKNSLVPSTHRVEIKYLAKDGKKIEPIVKVTPDREGTIEIIKDGKRMFGFDEMTYGTRLQKPLISPNGNYIIAKYYDTDAKNNTKYWQRLYDAKTLKPMGILKESPTWLKHIDKYYVVRKDFEHGRHIVVIDPLTQEEEILATNIPDGEFAFSPKGDYLLYYLDREGKKENDKIYQVLEPSDRMRGWRDRSYPAIYRLDGSNALIPLAQGEYNINVTDISPDGSKLLIMIPKSRLTKRPSTVYDLLLFDVNTLKSDTIVKEDGFLSFATFSPDGKKALISGSPEFHGRIGCELPDSVTPSMIQDVLFIADLSDKTIKPLTRNFKPNPTNSLWSWNDGMIYAKVEDRDAEVIYQINPKNGEFKRLDLPENYIKGFTLAKKSPLMAWYGQSESSPDVLYLTDLSTNKTSVLDKPSESRISKVRLGECKDWNFTNSRGDTIYGRYYLPDNFDPAKKYPMIVYYYGGCSPTPRYFDNLYAWHLFAQHGYVVYVIQPSGATGFGQEFSSRHVATAGEGVAQDIIEGTKKFAADHNFVNPDKIGCIGASYGGFMTQYLQTVTDMFAAAVSHAGISDHSSYWGEGYWGHSYSEVSMGDNMPWSNPDLYVKHSPLYNADKIHTPLLLIHGDADTNVPVGESIQLFTALKRLGRETALVQVSGENHYIMDLEKRRMWQNTIMAWFAKYLQDNDTWWNDLYPAKGK